MKGLGLFSDIGKKAKVLLTKDYTYDQKVTLSTVTASGVVCRLRVGSVRGPRGCGGRQPKPKGVRQDWELSFISEGLTSTAVKKGGLYSLGISSVYKHKNTLINVKVDTESNIFTTLTVLEALPSTKLVISVKLPDYNSGKLELQYLHENASFTTVVGMKPSPVVEFSGTVGAQGVAFGAEGGYDTATGKCTKYSAGIGVTRPDYHAAFILADKGDTMKLSGLYHFDEKQKASAVAELTRKLSTNENTLTVGGLYAVDPQTTVKARLNNSGKLAALVQHEVKRKSLLTISGEFDTKALDRPPKFGLALVLKP